MKKIPQHLIGIILLGILLLLAITVISIQIKKSSEIIEADLVKPNAITVDKSIDKNTLNRMIRTAQFFYTFWNTGQFKYLNAAVGPNFTIHALPKESPKNIDDLKNYSIKLRSAIPELHCTIEDLLVTGDRITARLLYSGTSKLAFNGYPPTGKPVKFAAIDILQIQNGKIIEEWHMEDSLALLQQLNIVSVKI